MTDPTPKRVFKIGSVRLVEDAALAGKTPQEVQQLLAPLYPQIENASLRESTDPDTGLTLIEWLPRPGRKG